MLAVGIQLACSLSICSQVSAEPTSIGAMVSASYDYSFQDKWYYVDGEYIPRLTKATEFVKYQDIWIYVSLIDYRLDGNKRAKVTFDLDIIGPDGVPVEELRDLVAIDSRIDNSAHVQLGITVIKFIATSDYLLGTYAIEVTVRDEVGGSMVETITEVELVPFMPEPAPANMDDLEDWMMAYFGSPTPIKATSAFLYLARSGYSQTAVPAFMGFFAELFRHNQYQLPTLLEKYPTLSEREKKHVLWLLKYIDYSADSFLDKLTKEERAEYSDPSAGFHPHIDGDIDDPGQLDWLWGTFLASGSADPIRKLVSVLGQSKYEKKVRKATERFQKTGAPANPDRGFMLGAVYQAAKWSIDSNCKQHLLVRAYCEYFLEYEKLDKAAKKALKEILEG